MSDQKPKTDASALDVLEELDILSQEALELLDQQSKRPREAEAKGHEFRKVESDIPESGQSGNSTLPFRSPDRGNWIEVQIDGLWFAGKVFQVDESFDHEFGTERGWGYEIRGLEIRACFGDFDSALDPKGLAPDFLGAVEAELIKRFQNLND